MPIKKNIQQQDFFDLDPNRDDESDLIKGATEAVVTGTDWTTDTILTQMRRGNIDLSPKFQRREAWTDDRKSKFIESLFLGYPVPQLVLAEAKQPKGKYIVIDGKQRLLAIRRFAATTEDSPFVPLRLIELEFRKDLNGNSLEELRTKSKFKHDIDYYENQPIRTVVIRNWEYEDVLYRIFIRLNTGSLPLSTQELRQALHPGSFSNFSDDFAANSSALQQALHINGPDFRMRDVEILVRYFAFAMFLSEYRGNLKEFLDRTCDRLNKQYESDPESIELEAKRCVKAIETTIVIFREDSFKRWNADERKFDGPFNRAIFDVMTYYFRQEDIAEQAKQKCAEVLDAFKTVCTQTKFLNSIQTTTKSLTATSSRLNIWGMALRKVLNMDVSIPYLKDKRIVVP